MRKNPLVKLEVEVSPRSRRPGVAGKNGKTIKVKVAAAPVDGQANAELIKILAKFFGVPKTAVQIKLGTGGKRKLIHLYGVTDDDVCGRLKLIPEIDD